MSEVPKSKLEEQATAKAELSYSYWAANAVTSPAPVAVPKKLTEEEAAAQHRALEEHRESTGASAWNKAGTFEERNVTEWAKARLAELLEGAACPPAHQGGSVSITAISSCAGEAHQWLVRGKKRGGFEFVLGLKWRAELDSKSWAAGSVRIPEASADDLEELRLEGLKVTERSEGLAGADEERARQAVKETLLLAVEAKLRELVELLKQR
ncbi:hypothetical protein N2152v2_010602 [Parachlorella kessleri]